MAGCATRHHKWAVNPAVPGTKCVGKGATGTGCLAVFGEVAPAREAPPAPPGAPVSSENSPAPAPRAMLGAALTAARGAPAAPGAAVPAPGRPAAPALPEPNAWQRIAGKKIIRLLFVANDKAMELRHREPAEDAPEDDDPEFAEASSELSKSLAIWFPATALPPWGNAAIITAGMLADRWIMSTPLPDDAKPAVAAPIAAKGAATSAAPPPPVTSSPGAPAVETNAELG